MSGEEENKKRDFEEAFFSESSNVGRFKKFAPQKNQSKKKKTHIPVGQQNSVPQQNTGKFIFKLPDNELKLETDSSETIKIEDFLKDPIVTNEIQPKSLSKFNMSTVSHPGINFRMQPSNFQVKMFNNQNTTPTASPTSGNSSGKSESKKSSKAIKPNPNSTKKSQKGSNAAPTEKVDETSSNEESTNPVFHPKPVKINEGPDLCTDIDITAFIKSLREGLTSGLTSRNYLQKTHHKMWIPVTLSSNSLKTGVYLTIDFIYSGTNVKSLVFPIKEIDEKFGAEADFDLTTEKCIF
jgi:hypothetical protein